MRLTCVHLVAKFCSLREYISMEIFHKHDTFKYDLMIKEKYFDGFVDECHNVIRVH